MSSKAPNTSSLSDFLRFDAGRPELRALFVPGANWRKKRQYPELKPLDSFTRDDYFRLAWELLRRMPRYRRQYRKLEDLGIKTATFFKPSSSSFYSSDNPPGFPGWANVPLRGHKCEPPMAFQDDTFGTYIEAQTAAGQPWLVMNRRKWVMDFWGLHYLPDPTTPFDGLPKRELFNAPAASVTVVSNAAPADRPRVVNTYLRQNEILIRFRLDASLDQQIASVRQEVERAQEIAVERAQSVLDPLPLPGRRKAGKNALSDEDAAFQHSPRVRAKAGRVLLKQLELSPFWLRTWDAIAEARMQQGIAEPRLDRKGIIDQFDDVCADLPTESDVPKGSVSSDFSAEVDMPDDEAIEVTTRPKREQGLKQVVGDALTPAMVPNWGMRSEKYIEKSDEAFRQLVALAFTLKAD